MQLELNVNAINVVSAEEAIRDSDIVITATMSTFPYVKRE
jgi:ornithine cyclodeaminase